MTAFASKAIAQAVRRGKITRQRACTSKHGFSQERAIRQAGVRTRETGEAIVAYPCIFCERWHIGHSHSIKKDNNED